MITAILTCGLFVGMATQETGVVDDRAEMVEWFAACAKPISTTDPRADSSDLQCLHEIVGEARIVGLGEATHGTRDFFQLKHRTVRFLVEEMGFTHFGFEAGFAECRAIDRYICTGEGDIASMLADLQIWVWNTEEVLDLIEWLREHNADPECEALVRFVGFDMRAPAASARQLLPYLDAVDTGFAAGEWSAAEEVRTFLKKASGWAPGPISAEDRDESQRIVEILLSRFEEMEEDYARASTVEEAVFGRQLAVVVGQASQVAPLPGGAPQPLSLRDEFMAKNTSWLLEQAGGEGKVVIWAHNMHISQNGFGIFQSQGSFLREEHGDDYLAFGFSFRQGEFQAMQNGVIQAFEVGPHGADSFDGVLGDAGHRRAFFDIRNVETGGAAHTWLNTPQRIRTIGAFYSDSMESAGRGAMPTEPACAFDVWIFADRTQRARPVGMPGGDGGEK